MIGKIKESEVCSALALELAATPVGTRLVVGVTVEDKAFGAEETLPEPVLGAVVAVVESPPGEAVVEALPEADEALELCELGPPVLLLEEAGGMTTPEELEEIPEPVDNEPLGATLLELPVDPVPKPLLELVAPVPKGMLELADAPVPNGLLELADAPVPKGLLELADAPVPKGLELVEIPVPTKLREVVCDPPPVPSREDGDEPVPKTADEVLFREDVRGLTFGVVVANGAVGPANEVGLTKERFPEGPMMSLADVVALTITSSVRIEGVCAPFDTQGTGISSTLVPIVVVRVEQAETEPAGLITPSET